MFARLRGPYVGGEPLLSPSGVADRLTALWLARKGVPARARTLDDLFLRSVNGVLERLDDAGETVLRLLKELAVCLLITDGALVMGAGGGCGGFWLGSWEILREVLDMLDSCGASLVGDFGAMTSYSSWGGGPVPGTGWLSMPYSNEITCSLYMLNPRSDMSISSFFSGSTYGLASLVYVAWLLDER